MLHLHRHPVLPVGVLLQYSNCVLQIARSQSHRWIGHRDLLLLIVKAASYLGAHPSLLLGKELSRHLGQAHKHFPVSHQDTPYAEGLPEGLRGNGGQGFAARIWGVSNQEYQRLAEPWPLNSEGEILIGLKIEDRHALENSEASTAVPGVGFSEWGPGDMRMSYDVDSGTAQVLIDARARVLAATKAAGIPFLNTVNTHNIEAMIDEGVRIGANPGAEVAAQGRRYTNRRMPW